MLKRKNKATLGTIQFRAKERSIIQRICYDYLMHTSYRMRRQHKRKRKMVDILTLLLIYRMMGQLIIYNKIL